MQEEVIADEPLLDVSTTEYPKKSRKCVIMSIVSGLSAFVALALISAAIILSDRPSQVATNTVKSLTRRLKKYVHEPLPGCQIHPGLVCPGASGDMDEKWADHLWNTPPRGSEKWKPGYQDMNVLTGYAQLKYSSDHKSCVVNIITKTAEPLTLKYYFDGVAQDSPSKQFDSSYNGILKLKVEALSGEKLELADIDFLWNVGKLASRPGDENYRNGQKGAIVELFGWPDEDIAQECKHIAEAGYLGVKLFPHQEQIMSQQPFENELNPWSFMYQPVSYRLDGRMGSRDTLRQTINKCRSYGLRVYADAVVNHMSGCGNDMSDHRNPDAGCTTWPGKNSSAGENQSPFYTHCWTYEYNDYTGKPNNVLEFPGVPYGPMDFHCEKALNAWTDPNNLNTGWLVGLSDLDTSKDFVRQRIADFFIDLLSIGFSGFRIDAAKHIHPNDLAVIFAKFKEGLGGNIPEDWFTWLEVLTGGESWLLVRDSEYSFTTGLTNQMKAQGLSDEDIEKVKIWWSGYPVEPDNDEGTITRTRKVIQNDDHDQQSNGSSSRDMHDEGCVLVKGCDPDKHRGFEIKLFEDPKGAQDNDKDYPIRMVLSSYYFTSDGATSIPDGKSDCAQCLITCDYCKSRSYAKAYVENAQAYAGSDYTRVHRDAQIIAAMRKWMKLD